MYVEIIATACLASVIILAIVLATYAAHIKTDFDTKMRSFVDQVNTTQFYQYELEKKSHDKLNILDNNVTSVKSTYIPRKEINDNITTKNITTDDLHAKKFANIAQAKLGDHHLKPEGKSLHLNMPIEGVFHVKNAANAAVMSVDSKEAHFGSARIDNLSMGDKFALTVNDDKWMRIVKPDRSDYYGGAAMANLWVRDKTDLNGEVNVHGKLTVDRTMNIKGGRSQLNNQNLPTQFSSLDDGRNYIRGDTEFLGNTSNLGNMYLKNNLEIKGYLKGNEYIGNRMKLGHSNIGSFYDESPLSVVSAGTGASFGNKYFSHFPARDGSTYIRPGKDFGNVFIGDVGNTKQIVLGDANTTSKVSGSLCVSDVCFTKDDMSKIKETASVNLLELQKSLTEKMNDLNKQIDIAAMKKANEGINEFKTIQQANLKSLQEQIDEIKKQIDAIAAELRTTPQR